jgi:hypothetical protein
MTNTTDTEHKPLHNGQPLPDPTLRLTDAQVIRLHRLFPRHWERNKALHSLIDQFIDLTFTARKMSISEGEK